MQDMLQPYLELANDAGLALTDAGYAYGLLINAMGLLALAGLLVLCGLIATHGKSHGTRFSAMAVFCCAGLAGFGAWMVRPDAAAADMLSTLLQWAWVPPVAAGLSIVTTMAKNPMPRAAGLALATAVALCATVYGGMLSVTNAKAAHPEEMAWLDAEPLPQPVPANEQVAEVETLPVLDTAHNR